MRKTLDNSQPCLADWQKLAGLYREWNSKINVISRKDIDNVYEHHIMHSLAILRYMQLSGREDSLAGKLILDAGCGGGFPGIPLAMMLPGTRFVLCDSVGKKVRVAEAVAAGMGLANVQCVNARIESLPCEFDYVVSRAVAPLSTLYRWTKGKFSESLICLKGGDVDSEIDELCHREGILPSKVAVWPLRDFLPDEYYSEKYLIEVKR